jgi:hypothetical protein
MMMMMATAANTSSKKKAAAPKAAAKQAKATKPQQGNSPNKAVQQGSRKGYTPKVNPAMAYVNQAQKGWTQSYQQLNNNLQQAQGYLSPNQLSLALIQCENLQAAATCPLN